MSSLRLLAAVLALGVLAGCSAAAEPRAAATDRCGAVEVLEIQGGGHLIGEQPPPVPYNSVPPTSGWHASGSVPIAVQEADDPLTEPEQVSVLEAGAAVVAHGPLPDTDRAALQRLVTERFPGRVAVTPYAPLGEGEVVFTVWGALQRCEALDLDALAAFVEAHAVEEPHVPGQH